ncbi:MAG: hypothetical protein ABI555_06020, partial [Chloroflexota bacterium]
RRALRPLPILALLLAAALSGCGSTVETPLPTIGPAASSSAPGDGSASPDATTTQAPTPVVTPPPSGEPGTPSPSDGPTAATVCTGSESNRAFFSQAAAGVAWSVYCAVLPDGWYLETGSYRLANEGHLEVTYRGPGDAHVSIAEGNICLDVGGDVEQCAPRDTVIADAALGDMVGELGRLSNGLVLDVDRGANPSWRVTGLGIAEDEFTALGAAMIKVPAAP